MTKTTKLLTAAELNDLRRGDFALTQDLDGNFRVLNVRTGTKTKVRLDKKAAIRVRDAAAR